jgi:hypothetical protein
MSVSFSLLKASVSGDVSCVDEILKVSFFLIILIMFNNDNNLIMMPILPTLFHVPNSFVTQIAYMCNLIMSCPS